MGKLTFFVSSSMILASFAWPTRDQVQDWALLFFGLAGLSVPVIKKFVENLITLRKASRDSLRKDCFEELRRERLVVRDLKARIRSLEGECDDWKRRFDSGSREHPKMG